MRGKLVIPLLAMLGLAGPAMAGQLSYNLVEIGLIGDSIDDPHGPDDLSGSGVSLSGSLAFNPNLFGFASISGTDYEYVHYNDDFNASQQQAGLGLHFPLTPQLDLVSGVSLQHLRLDNDYDSLDESGYGLDVGLRGLIGRRLEWTAAVNYVDYGGGDNDTFWTAGFRYYFTRVFALGMDVGSTNRNEANAVLAFRWDFNNRR